MQVSAHFERLKAGGYKKLYKKASRCCEEKMVLESLRRCGHKALDARMAEKDRTCMEI